MGASMAERKAWFFTGLGWWALRRFHPFHTKRSRCGLITHLDSDRVAQSINHMQDTEILASTRPDAPATHTATDCRAAMSAMSIG